MSCSDGPRRHTADEAAGSAIYECGYNSCGCNLKLSEVRSCRGRLGSIWSRFGARRAPNRPQIDPKRPRPDLGQPQIAAT